MPLTTLTSFFGSPDGDDDLENLNQEFWRSLLGHIRSGCPIDEVHSILDVGCNRGGLLELLARHFKPEVLFGLEPMADARQCATFRLKGSAAEVKILRPARWPTIPTASVDLVTAHEVLYLISDISSFMSSLARVIRPGGWAFVVLGCHTENPVWQRWKSQIEELGHETYDYSPMDVVRVASAAGFHTSVRPLRRDGWVIYDPATAEFQYSTVAEMFDHQYRQKLLFRLAKGKATARS